MHVADVHDRSGYKFDSGGLRVRGTNEVVPTMTEQDVFRALKLKYIRESLSDCLLSISD
jgi:DNA polymerase/3'-5' exonuclease PolX